MVQFASNLATRRVPIALLTILLVPIFGTGCFPLGIWRGHAQVAAKRTEADGFVTEQILLMPTEHHWCMLFTPEGPELNHVTSQTWNFYIADKDGHRHRLHFLGTEHDNWAQWVLIAPISHTNLWVAVFHTGSPKRVEQGRFDYRVICFTGKAIISDQRLDYRSRGTFRFDSETHLLIYEMGQNSQSYDPLANTRVP